MVKRGEGKRHRSEKQKPLRDEREPAARAHPLTTLGAEAADRWLLALGLPTVAHWHVEIAISADIDSSFELNIYGEEWGFVFRNDGRGSWIRITDIPFVHGRDDFQLLARAPDLLTINGLVTQLETEHGLKFRRANASIRTNIPEATETVREWLMQPLPSSRAKKKTVELCGDVMHDGIRCTKPRGHDGDHEYQGRDGLGLLRWK